jgi:hypothetical protein
MAAHAPIGVCKGDSGCATTIPPREGVTPCTTNRPLNSLMSGGVCCASSCPILGAARGPTGPLGD